MQQWLGRIAMMWALTGLSSVWTAPARAADYTGVVIVQVSGSPSGQSLVDADIVLDGPTLEAPRMSVTDRSGQASLAKLPPGEFTLRVERTGYLPFQRGLTVRLNRQLRVNVTLLPQSP